MLQVSFYADQYFFTWRKDLVAKQNISRIFNRVSLSNSSGDLTFGYGVTSLSLDFQVFLSSPARKTSVYKVVQQFGYKGAIGAHSDIEPYYENARCHIVSIAGPHIPLAELMC